MDKIRKVLFVFLSGVGIAPGFTQTQTESANHRGDFFFYWGYNRTSFGPSDLHFSGPEYNFTVHRASAHDRPSEPGLIYIDPARFSIPQYNYRLGYFIGKNFSISGGLDHIKYVMDQNQTARVSGYISAAASEKYQGVYKNKEMNISRDFLRFEHTNGFNLATMEAEYLWPVAKIKNWLRFSFNSGVGGFLIVTKTDVALFGQGLDNDFHLAGYAMTAKGGPRLEFWHSLFLAYEWKWGYATLPDVILKNAASPDRGHHNVQFLEKYVVVGKYFHLLKKKK